MSQISYGAVLKGSTILCYHSVVAGDFNQWAVESINQIHSDNTLIIDKISSKIFISKDQSNNVFYICAGH